MLRLFLLLLPIFLLASFCYAAADLPTAAQAAAIAAAPAPEAATPPKDEFKGALVNVYNTQPQLKAQREALKATDEGVAQAISGFRPTAIAGYSQGRQRSEINQTGREYQNAKDKTLDVTQPIFNGGGTLASYSSAKERVKAGRAQLTALEQQVLYNAVVAYTDVVTKQSLLEVNQNNVDVLSKQLDATKARFDVGELTRTDTAQAEARLASAQAAERQAAGDLASSRATFKRIIGYDAPQAIELPPVPSALPQTMQEASDWAQATEPTLEAARHLEKAAESDVDIRTAIILPSVNVEGTMFRDNNPAPGQFRSNGDAIMMNVTIPLYQSGSEWSQMRQAKNLAQQAKFTTFDTRDSAIENVTRAWQDFNTATAVITSNEKAVNAAEIALDDIRQENKYGTRTVLDVLNTEQDMFNARLSLVNAKAAEKQQAYRLLAAVGRLTAKDLGLAVDLFDPKQHYDNVKYKLIGP